MNTNGVVKIFTERKDELRGADVLRAARRRAADVAGQLSRRGAMAAAAELCNEAVDRLIQLAYETDETGLCNVDASTGVFEAFPMPWGRSYTRYGLRATEKAVLAIHVKRLQLLNRPVPLWTYDPGSRRWGVNLWDYPTAEDALTYWCLVALDANSYKTLLDTVRSGRSGDA